MKLDPGDFASVTWNRTRLMLLERLAELRVQNDNLSHDATKTAAIRGRIAEVQRILGWPLEAAAVAQAAAQAALHDAPDSDPLD